VPTLRADLPDGDADALRIQMRDCLESRGGEVSSRARAAGLGHSYLNLNDRGRKRFLQILAEDFRVDWQHLYAASRDIHETESLERALETEERLREILTSRRLKVLTRFNSLPEGVKFLVDMRADVIRWSADDLHLQSLEKDLRGLLVSWFDVGFLELKRITWDSPAALLEKLIAYEAVHEIRSWEDLKNRLGADRRCYAFFHPRMPEEPLIFVQVALVSGISSSIQELLDETIAPVDPMTANTAVFYSISNTQTGLQGVSFGSFLIKRVVDRLAQELPGISTFVTLSPIPGFRGYLESKLSELEGGLLTGPDKDVLGPLIEAGGGRRALGETLSAPNWCQDGDVAQKLKKPLTRICAHYLVHGMTGGRALDSVANFHLSNGASIEQIDWLGDVSPKGMQQSLGLMVNYRYHLANIEANHEAYRTSGEVHVSARVKRLLALPK
jgi:malonyl-CoA decarboxylase